MKVKVCGLNDVDNLKAISALEIDMVGFNFYPPSPRYIVEDVAASDFVEGARDKEKVGVFVKSSVENLIRRTEQFKLDYIQLHGDESPQYCFNAKQYAKLIKVFRVGEDFRMADVEDYIFADFFIFDKKASVAYGGTGHKFDWSIFSEYKVDVPFMLSGGLGPDDVAAIKELEFEKLLGVDINSKFESSPGVKDVELVKTFIQALKSEL